MGWLDGTVALVTGSGSGIGKAVVQIQSGTFRLVPTDDL